MSVKRPTRPRPSKKKGPDWKRQLDLFVKRYGQKISSEEINRLLHERFGD